MRRGLALVGLAAFLLLLQAVPVFAVNPSVSQIGASSAQAVSTLSLSLNSVSLGNSLLVFEYLSPSVDCTFLLQPTDSLTHSWTPLGCVTDGNLGSQEVFLVQSSSASGADTVTCNFRRPVGASVESCYVFNVANPGGRVSIISSATGQNSQIPVLVGVAPNSLVLATVGLSGGCHTVSSVVQSPAGLNVIGYNPGSACASLNNRGQGLSGSLIMTIAPGGYQWTMDPIFGGGGATFSPAWSLFVIQIPGPSALTTSTTFTGTLTGWLVPDAIHLSNALLLMMLPLGAMGFTTFMMKAFRTRGDVGVYFALGGLVIGAVMADLPANSANQSQIPFAYAFAAGVLAFLYWWNS